MFKFILITVTGMKDKRNHPASEILQLAKILRRLQTFFLRKLSSSGNSRSPSSPSIYMYVRSFRNRTLNFLTLLSSDLGLISAEYNSGRLITLCQFLVPT